MMSVVKERYMLRAILLTLAAVGITAALVGFLVSLEEGQAGGTMGSVPAPDRSSAASEGNLGEEPAARRRAVSHRQGSRSITVDVFDAEARGPIAGAAVRAYRERAHSIQESESAVGVTSETGIIELPCSLERFIISHDDYIAAAVDIPEGQTEMRVAMRRGHCLDVSVTYLDGSAVPLARVLVSDLPLSLPHEFTTARIGHPGCKNRIWCAITDTNGIGSVRGLPPGSYFFRCVGPDCCPLKAPDKVNVPGDPVHVDMQSIFGVLVHLPPEEVAKGRKIVWSKWLARDLPTSRAPCVVGRSPRLVKELQEKYPGSLAYVVGLSVPSGGMPVSIEACSDDGYRYALTWTLAPIRDLVEPVPLERVGAVSGRRATIKIVDEGGAPIDVPIFVWQPEFGIVTRSGRSHVYPYADYRIEIEFGGGRLARRVLSEHILSVTKLKSPEMEKGELVYEIALPYRIYPFRLRAPDDAEPVGTRFHMAFRAADGSTLSVPNWSRDRNVEEFWLPEGPVEVVVSGGGYESKVETVQHPTNRRGTDYEVTLQSEMSRRQ